VAVSVPSGVVATHHRWRHDWSRCFRRLTAAGHDALVATPFSDADICRRGRLDRMACLKRAATESLAALLGSDMHGHSVAAEVSWVAEVGHP